MNLEVKETNLESWRPAKIGHSADEPREVRSSTIPDVPLDFVKRTLRNFALYRWNGTNRTNYLCNIPNVWEPKHSFFLAHRPGWYTSFVGAPGMSNAAPKIAPLRPDPGIAYRLLRDLQGPGRNLQGPLTANAHPLPPPLPSIMCAWISIVGRLGCYWAVSTIKVAALELNSTVRSRTCCSAVARLSIIATPRYWVWNGIAPARRHCCKAIWHFLLVRMSCLWRRA